MLRLAFPAAFAVLIWWAGTGVILWLNRRPAWTHRWTFAASSAVCIAALVGLWAGRGSTEVASRYCAFACAILVWAWQEIAFLFGYLTGPRRSPATPSLAGWARAEEAFSTVEHHELGLLMLGAIVIGISWDQPNQTGLWTFVVLWTMRQSAKINLFLGVRNLFEEFLPVRLRYMATYFRRSPLNPLFPVSVMAALAFAVPLWQSAWAATTESASAGLALVGTLLALAILEHLFLVVPLPSQALWRWAVRSG